MTARAEELYGRGLDLVNAGRPVAARPVLARAAEEAASAGDADLIARIDGTTAYLLAQLGDVDGGIALCRRALDDTRTSPATRAILAGQMGALELERGAFDSAVTWLTDAIDAFDGDPVRSANMRVNRALADMQRGRWDAADDDLRWAEQIYRAADMPLDAHLMVHNRGYLAMLEGDLVRALSAMQSVREPLDETSALWAAINELDRAEVLRDAGLVSEAESSLDRVARAFGRHRAPGMRARAEYQLARSLLDHDPVRAAGVAAASARRFRGLGSHAWAARADGVRMRARLSRGRLDYSGRPIETGRPPSATAVAAVAAELVDAGFAHDAVALRLAAALDDIRRGRMPPERSPRIRRDAPLEVALLSYELAAERARLAGSPALTRRRAARGIDLLESSTRSGGALEQQGSLARQGLSLLSVGLASALRSGRPDVVLEWSERSRHLQAQVVPLRPPPDPGLAAELAELRRLRLAQPDGDWLSDPRVEKLRARARERQWSSTRRAGVQARVDIEGVRSALDDDTALVSLVFDGRALVALVVTARAAHLVPLAWARVRAAAEGLRADLDVSASVRSGPMVRVIRAALDERLATLSREAIEPAMRTAGDPRRVVLTVPGVLAGVPWGMVPGLRGRPMTVAPSASHWVAARADPHPPAGRAVLAAGPRVARADEEVARAAQSWRTRALLRGDGATVAAVTQAASGADVLHIAAHGRHAADHPMFSGLELADGTLFGYDVDLIPEIPGTIVLSACEVGRSTVRWGEEAVGMTRVWLHAGARSVIAAPVVVADDVACELLGAMHDELAAGSAPAVALAAASDHTGLVAPFQAHGAGF